MKTKTTRLASTLRAYLTAAKAADQKYGTDEMRGTYLPAKIAELKADELAEPRQRLSYEASAALEAASAAGDAFRDRVLARMTSTADPQRVMAREAVWGRLSKRLEAGTSVSTLIRGGLSDIEAEALAAIAPGEPGCDFHPEDATALAGAYADMVDDPEVAALAEEAAEVRQVEALHGAARAIVEGRDLSGAERNALHRLDADLYREIVGDDTAAGEPFGVVDGGRVFG